MYIKADLEGPLIDAIKRLIAMVNQKVKKELIISQLDKRAGLGCHPFHVTLCGRIDKLLGPIFRSEEHLTEWIKKWDKIRGIVKLTAPKLLRVTNRGTLMLVLESKDLRGVGRKIVKILESGDLTKAGEQLRVLSSHTQSAVNLTPVLKRMWNTLSISAVGSVVAEPQFVSVKLPKSAADPGSDMFRMVAADVIAGLNKLLSANPLGTLRAIDATANAYQWSLAHELRKDSRTGLIKSGWITAHCSVSFKDNFGGPTLAPRDQFYHHMTIGWLGIDEKVKDEKVKTETSEWPTTTAGVKSMPEKHVLPPSFKHGDWMCPKCNAHNFASRKACFKCSAHKPQNEAKTRAKYKVNDYYISSEHLHITIGVVTDQSMIQKLFGNRKEIPLNGELASFFCKNEYAISGFGWDH
eukprot:jgi/Bigna1/142412/aug1.70_g17120